MDDLKPGAYKRIYGGLGTDMYITPCADCGAAVKTWGRKKDVIYKCAKCREAEKEIANQLKTQISELTRQRRLQSVIEIITRMYGNTDGYKYAVEVVTKKLLQPNWFQSVNEVLAALELVRQGVRARHQVPMGKWRCDFVLPDLKVVLEIDGKFHKEAERRDKDRVKDAAIIASLGPEWEIVRINDDLIRRNLKKLVPAINQVVKGRKKVRQTHGGQMPKEYSSSV